MMAALALPISTMKKMLVAGEFRESKHSKVRMSARGGKARLITSPLTGAKIPATKDGFPSARRPLNYDHGPSEKAMARRIKRQQASR
jgi:hypothetical protein